MFICYFAYSDLGVGKYFEKEGAAEESSADFQIEHWGTYCTLVMGLRKISWRTCLLFTAFGGKKKKKEAFKSFLYP